MHSIFLLYKITQSSTMTPLQHPGALEALWQSSYQNKAGDKLQWIKS